jgi:hypothetical protein
MAWNYFDTRVPFQFNRCIKCSESGEMTRKSVFKGLSIVGKLIPVWGAVELVVNRESVAIPVCESCRRIVWPIRFAHLLMFVLLFGAAWFFLDADAFGRTVLGLMAGGFISVISYMITRNWCIGIEVRPNTRGGFQYLVASRFAKTFKEEVSR